MARRVSTNICPVTEALLNRHYSKSIGEKYQPARSKLMFQEMKDLVIEFESKFIYDPDGWGGMKNRIQTPTDAFYQRLGDCDDFASGGYCLGVGFERYLFTYFATDPRKAHTILIVIHDNRIWAQDWGHWIEFKSLQALVMFFEDVYKVKVFSIHAATYNYALRRYFSASRHFRRRLKELVVNRKRTEEAEKALESGGQSG